MKTIYQLMFDAIAACERPCEVIVLGSNEAAGSSRWIFPEKVCIHRFDALGTLDSAVTRAVVHVHHGAMIFHAIDVSEGPPNAWIHGISSLKPERNAQNMRSGSRIDRDFIAAHLCLRPETLTPVAELGLSDRSKFFIMDLEGIDFDITLRLITRQEILGIGFEHALLTDEEIIELRCQAILRGFRFESSDEDTIFLRP